ncbi:MAG: discoidin domain-containing protein [Acidobacteriia bacterium]|nr:discoidin domain-containing protein [Terriglobia bacterium]
MTLPRVARAPSLIAAAGYTVLTCVLLWPLPIQLSTVLPHDLGDPLLNTWILWWNAHAVPLTARWWNAPMFWPASSAFAFSEHLLGISVLTTPMQWLGATPVTAYNVALLLSFPLTALAAHALVLALTDRRDAAVVAGLMFGFAPYRTAQLGHLQMLLSFWMPLALLALHRYVDGSRQRWLWIFGAAWLLQALSNGYFLFFFSLLVALWLAWFASGRAERRSLAAILAAWTIAAVPLAPILWKYREVQVAFDFRRDLTEVAAYSADIAALLTASPHMRFWTLDIFRAEEGELFPGVTAVALLIAVAGVWLWRAPRTDRVPRMRAALLVASAFLAAAAVSTPIVGPWSIAVRGLTVVSVGAASKPLAQAIVCFVAAMAIDPRVVALARARSRLMFYACATVVMYVLSLGPVPRFLGAPVLTQGPYVWLMRLPGFDGLRVPARFAMLGVLCLSVAAGLAFARLAPAARGRRRRLAWSLVAIGLLFDETAHGIAFPGLPPRMPLLESAADRAVVLELPAGNPSYDLQAMYRAMYHGRPLVNGYSGYFPPHYVVMQYAGPDDTDALVDAMTARGPLVIRVDSDRDPGARIAHSVITRRGMTPLGNDAGGRLYAVPATPPDPPVTGSRLPIASVSSNVTGSSPARMIDGALGTWWTTGANQRGGETVTIDLGAPRTISAVILSVGAHPNDYPRALAIDLSDDGAEWRTVWTGRGAARALTAAADHPHEIPLSFPLPPSRARVVRLRQTGADAFFYWTVAELAVIGADAVVSSPLK